MSDNELGQVDQEEESLAEQIRELLAEGYSAKEILQTGLYKESTVRQEVRKWMKKNSPKANNNGARFPIKLGKGDFIPVETALDGVHLQDGEYRSGFIDGMRTLIIAAKFNQILTANQAEITTSQLQLLKEAKTDAENVAQTTIATALPYFERIAKEASIASSPNPVAAMFTRLMEPMFGSMFSRMFPGMLPQGQQPGQSQQFGLPPGWSYSPGGEK